MKSDRKLILTPLLFAALFIQSIFAFAQNKVVRDVDSFDQVDISDNMNVVFIKSETEKVTITAAGIGYDKIVTESEGRELKIRFKTGIYKNTDVNIEVHYVKIRSVDAGNKAVLTFNDEITGDELSLKATGGAVINIKIDISALTASLSNGGRIEISGKTDLQQVEANIGSKYNAYDLKSENGFVKSNTNSDVVVWVTNKLEATAGSKAEIKYRGKPAEVVSSTNLGGKITGNLD